MSELELVYISLSEVEVLRLCDRDRLDQEAAGAQMGVSRGTVQRLLKSARQKVATAIVGSGALVLLEGESHESLCSN